MSALEKPPYGSECNGCGGCCEDQLCPLASAVFPDWRTPCPALEPSGVRAKTCGLINDPMRYAPVRIAVQGRKGLSGAIKPGEIVDPAVRANFVRAAVRAYSKGEIRDAKRWWRLA